MALSSFPPPGIENKARPYDHPFTDPYKGEKIMVTPADDMTCRAMYNHLEPENKVKHGKSTDKCCIPMYNGWVATRTTTLQIEVMLVCVIWITGVKSGMDYIDDPTMSF